MSQKIIEGLGQAIRFAKGDRKGARRVTTYITTGCSSVEVEDGCGCIWCDIGLKPKAGKHKTARGAFPCTKKK